MRIYGKENQNVMEKLFEI